MRLTPGQEYRLSKEEGVVKRALITRQASEANLRRSLPQPKPFWYNPYWKYILPFYALSIGIIVLGIIFAVVAYHATDDKAVLPGLLVSALGFVFLFATILLDRSNLRNNPVGLGDQMEEDTEVDAFEITHHL